MKNRNNQFNATVRRGKTSQRFAGAHLLLPLLLVCFAVFFSATTAAAASGPVTFNGTVSGKIPADMGQRGSGVRGTLADPMLDLRDGNGAPVAFNNDWEDDATQAAAMRELGIPPQNARESAIVATLGTGPHTVIVSGNDGSKGVALVEIYTLQ